MDSKDDIIFTQFSQEMLSGFRLPIITIYHNRTKEYPGYYVARIFEGVTADASHKVLIEKALDDLLIKIPCHFMMIPRYETDKPEIMMTYL